MVEGERADGLQHERADALALMGEPQPGTGLARPRQWVVVGAEGLHRDDLPAPADDEVDRPWCGCQPGPGSPVVGGGVASQLLGRRVCPGHGGRHRLRQVDAGRDQLDECGMSASVTGLSTSGPAWTRRANRGHTVSAGGSRRGSPPAASGNRSSSIGEDTSAPAPPGPIERPDLPGSERRWARHAGSERDATQSVPPPRRVEGLRPHTPGNGRPAQVEQTSIPPSSLATTTATCSKGCS